MAFMLFSRRLAHHPNKHEHCGLCVAPQQKQHRVSVDMALRLVTLGIGDATPKDFSFEGGIV